MLFILSKIFEFFAAPTHLALFVAGLGAALLYSPAKAWGRRLTALGAVLLFAMAFGPFADMMSAPLETRFPPPPGDMPAPDGVIVLGGSVDEKLSAEVGRIVFTESAQRLTAPLELLQRYPKARLVFTGGSGTFAGPGVTEAATVKEFWREIGLDRGEALYEDRARNTVENAQFTRDLVKPKPGERWLLVTSATHMPRSVGIFRKIGFPVIPYPVDYQTSGRLWDWQMPHSTARNFRLIDLSMHEWYGLLVNRLSGKSDDFFPAP
jgi:uncharacterized SAM-binding protein YcdF (DUF218 family)